MPKTSSSTVSTAHLSLFTKSILYTLLWLVTAKISTRAQRLSLPPHLRSTDTALPQAMSNLAKKVIRQYSTTDRVAYLNNSYRLHITANDPAVALIALDSLIPLYKKEGWERAALSKLPAQCYLRAKKGRQAAPDVPFTEIIRDTLAALYARLPEVRKPFADTYFDKDTAALRKELDELLARQSGKDSVGMQEALDVTRAYADWKVARQVQPPGKAWLAAEDKRRYIIRDSLHRPWSHPAY